eukprot:UC4_evm1s719
MSQRVTCISFRRFEIMIGTSAGAIECSPCDNVHFDATAALVLSQVSFLPASTSRIPQGVYAMDIHYSGVMKILAVGLSDGTAAIFSMPKRTLDNKNVTGRWVP